MAMVVSEPRSHDGLAAAPFGRPRSAAEAGRQGRQAEPDPETRHAGGSCQEGLRRPTQRRELARAAVRRPSDQGRREQGRHEPDTEDDG
jgi:hypothetical protein